MPHVFISYVEENGAIVAELAAAIEQLGHQTWYYERDSLPGLSYLNQIVEAIGGSTSVIVILSKSALASNQMNMEIVQAHESGKWFIPILHEITHGEFRAGRPDWAMMMGGITSVALPKDGISRLAPRIAESLRRTAGSPPVSQPSQRPGLATPEPAPVRIGQPEPNLPSESPDEPAVPRAELVEVINEAKLDYYKFCVTLRAKPHIIEFRSPSWQTTSDHTQIIVDGQVVYGGIFHIGFFSEAIQAFTVVEDGEEFGLSFGFKFVKVGFGRQLILRLGQLELYRAVS